MIPSRSRPNTGTAGICLLIVLVLLLWSGGCMQKSPSITGSSPSTPAMIVFNDSLGNRIELPHEATRIIAGNSAVAEMLVTIGAGDRIVGITDSVKIRPEIMNRIPASVKSIGTADTPDLETIISLHPDVLLLYGPSSGHQAENLEKILASNIRVITLDCYKFDGVSNDASALGQMTNNSVGAQRYIEFNRKYVNLVQSRLANLTPAETPLVYAESTSDYTVLNRVSGIGQILVFLHARNVYNTTAYEFPKVSPEWVMEQNPDIILKPGESITGANLSGIHAQLINRTGFNQIKAVKNNRVYIYNSEIIGRPRVVVGMVYIAKALYPSRFTDIDPDAVADEYENDFGFGNQSMENIYPRFQD